MQVSDPPRIKIVECYGALGTSVAGGGTHKRSFLVEEEGPESVGLDALNTQILLAKLQIEKLVGCSCLAVTKARKARRPARSLGIVSMSIAARPALWPFCNAQESTQEFANFRAPAGQRDKTGRRSGPVAVLFWSSAF